MDENPQVVPHFYTVCTILFRAVSHAYLVKNDGSHKPKVFIRRDTADPRGVSVATSIQGCKDLLPGGVFGVRSLRVGEIARNGIDYFPDEDDPSHANIKYRDGRNIPTRLENDPEARSIGSDLLAWSRPVEYWDAPDADERFNRELEAKRAARRA